MPPLTPSPLDMLIPILITFVKQAGFPTRWNAWIALAMYAVWTAVSLFLGLRSVEGPLTLEIFLSSFVTAAATGYISYQLFWKQLPGDAEQRLEEATSVVKGPVSDEIVVDEEAPTGGNG